MWLTRLKATTTNQLIIYALICLFTIDDHHHDHNDDERWCRPYVSMPSSYNALSILQSCPVRRESRQSQGKHYPLPVDVTAQIERPTVPTMLFLFFPSQLIARCSPGSGSNVVCISHGYSKTHKFQSLLVKCTWGIISGQARSWTFTVRLDSVAEGAD